MTTPLSPIGSPKPGLPGIASPGAGQASPDMPFADLIKGLVQETSGQQAQAEEQVQQLVAGETDSIHDVILTTSQADLAFRLVMEIRDRLISSYQEVMRMQM